MASTKGTHLNLSTFLELSCKKFKITRTAPNKAEWRPKFSVQPDTVIMMLREVKRPLKLPFFSISTDPAQLHKALLSSKVCLLVTATWYQPCLLLCLAYKRAESGWKRKRDIKGLSVTYSLVGDTGCIKRVTFTLSCTALLPVFSVFLFVWGGGGIQTRSHRLFNIVSMFPLLGCVCVMYRSRCTTLQTLGLPTTHPIELVFNL